MPVSSISYTEEIAVDSSGDEAAGSSAKGKTAKAAWACRRRAQKVVLELDIENRLPSLYEIRRRLSDKSHEGALALHGMVLHNAPW